MRHGLKVLIALGPEYDKRASSVLFQASSIYETLAARDAKLSDILWLLHRLSYNSEIIAIPNYFACKSGRGNFLKTKVGLTEKFQSRSMWHSTISFPLLHFPGLILGLCGSPQLSLLNIASFAHTHHFPVFKPVWCRDMFSIHSSA
jgi:hypothetical protein